MSEHELTPEQLAVVFAQSSEIAVIAAAGSGKTRVLVERYLRHVLYEGIHPDRILTITFTRKAAAEMKSRIVAGLRAAGAFEHAHAAETGPIQTIHSLCEQLLREHALKANIDAEFEILSDVKLRQIQALAIEEALALSDPEREITEELIAGLAGRTAGQMGPSPYSGLQSAMIRALGYLRSAYSLQHFSIGAFSDPIRYREHWKAVALSTMPDPIRELVRERAPENWKAVCRSGYKELAQKVPQWLNRDPKPEADTVCERQTCALVLLARDAWVHLERHMRRRQEFDFLLLEDLLLQLLRENQGCRPNFEVMMVDEAQDVSPKQNALLEQIGAQRRLLVGDHRQSIYSFRLADPEHFTQRYGQAALQLSKNHRSRPGLLNFVDDLFNALWSGAYVPMGSERAFDLDHPGERDYTGVEFWELQKDADQATARMVGQLLAEGEKASDICILTRGAQRSHRLHDAMSQQCIPSKIIGGAERFYARMEVRDIANILRSLADPYNDFSMLATLRGPAVGLSLPAIFRLGLKKPVVEALATERFDADDQQKVSQFRSWHDPLRAYADRVSAWEVVSRILEDSPFLTRLISQPDGARQVANVRKLLMLAAQNDSLDALLFADMIRDTHEFRHREGDAEEFVQQEGVVKLMTIHKSKGLEFPVVIVPETDSRLDKTASEVCFNSELHLFSTHFHGTAGSCFDFLSERHKESQVAEELRVFYVALTRAKRRLCVGMYPSSSTTSLSKFVRKAIGNPTSSLRIRIDEP